MKKKLGILIPAILILLVLLGLIGFAIFGRTHISHAYGEWEIVQKPTCTEPGKEERACSCGKTEQRELAALGHKKVVDAAVQATCTKEGLTEGSHCANCKEVYKEQEVIPAAHEEKTLWSIAPTCTRAGKMKGTECTECGELVLRQKKIRHMGHKYVNRVCTRCKQKQPDAAAAILIDQLNENKAANVITRKAYKGGTTITFRAFVPEDVTWWAVSWTKKASAIGLYNWAEGNGCQMNVECGKWVTCSATLPDDGANYYIYIVGAKGEWKGQELLIDDVVLTDSSGNVVGKDNFDNGIEDGLFKIIKTNPTNGRVVVYSKTICEKHKLVVDKAVAATCEESGKTEGSHCKLCKKIIVAQEDIPATGHSYGSDGTCTSCGKKVMDRALAINIDMLNDASDMNVITKQAYPGGSTVKLRALVPENTTWWAISWTTDKSNTDLYKWAEGLGESQPSTPNMWKEYSVTLPDDGKEYYVYIVGEKGQWGGQELLIDDIEIRAKSGEILAEDSFNYGIYGDVLQLIDMNPTNGQTVVREVVVGEICTHPTLEQEDGKEPTCTEPGILGRSYCQQCGKTIHAATELEPLGHDYVDDVCTRCGHKRENQVVALHMKYIREDGTSMISTNAYPGGSKVTFKALVPVTGQWWGLGYMAEGTGTDIYSIAPKSLNDDAKVGTWNEYSVTLPDDGKNYRIFFGGGKDDPWIDHPLLIDDVVIRDAGNTIIASDDFNDGFASGLFTVAEKDGDQTVVELQTLKQPEEEDKSNNVLALHMKYIREDGTSLKSKVVYPGGSKVTFKALVPVTGQWWGLGYVAEGSSTDIYSIAPKSLNDDAKVGTWNEYSVTLPDDGKNYYIFFGGGKDDPWIGNPLLIDDVVVTNASGTPIAKDDFEAGLISGIFNAIEMDGANTVVELQTLKEEAEEQENTVLALHMKYIREDGASLKSKAAYPGGSKVTFKALVLVTGQWWGLGYVAEGSSTDIYSIAPKSLNDDSKVGTWNEYSVTLPDDGKNYYIFFGGGKDNPWIGNPLLIDDVVVTNASGTQIAKDDFEAGLAAGIFNVIEMDGTNTVVELQTIKVEAEEQENTVLALHMKYIREDGTSLKSKVAYPGGSKVTFKALVPVTGQWWGLGYVAEGSSTDIYSIASKSLKDDAKVGTWNEYSVTLPDDGKNYYIFFGGGKDDPWIGNPLLIDDVVVTNASGTEIAKDDFEAGLTAGIFNAIEMDGSNIVVALVTK